MSVSSQNSYIEALIPSVLVSGDGTLGGTWVRMAGPWSDEISALTRRDTRELTPAYGHTERRWICEMPPAVDNAGTLISDFCLHNCEKINFYNVRHSFYRILLWQPKLTKTC